MDDLSHSRRGERRRQAVGRRGSGGKGGSLGSHMFYWLEEGAFGTFVAAVNDTEWLLEFGGSGSC